MLQPAPPLRFVSNTIGGAAQADKYLNASVTPQLARPPGPGEGPPQPAPAPSPQRRQPASPGERAGNA